MSLEISTMCEAAENGEFRYEHAATVEHMLATCTDYDGLACVLSLIVEFSDDEDIAALTTGDIPQKMMRMVVASRDGYVATQILDCLHYILELEVLGFKGKLRRLNIVGFCCATLRFLARTRYGGIDLDGIPEETIEHACAILGHYQNDHMFYETLQAYQITQILNYLNQ